MIAWLRGKELGSLIFFLAFSYKYMIHTCIIFICVSSAPFMNHLRCIWEEWIGLDECCVRLLLWDFSVFARNQFWGVGGLPAVRSPDTPLQSGLNHQATNKGKQSVSREKSYWLEVFSISVFSTVCQKCKMSKQRGISVWTFYTFM